jgi:formylglycine-generating enzyme required for sulfatase activity
VRDAEVHAFLRQLHADGVATIGPREHVLISRLLAAPPDDLGFALGALIGRDAEQAATVRARWNDRVRTLPVPAPAPSTEGTASPAASAGDEPEGTTTNPPDLRARPPWRPRGRVVLRAAALLVAMILAGGLLAAWTVGPDDGPIGPPPPVPTPAPKIVPDPEAPSTHLALDDAGGVKVRPVRVPATAPRAPLALLGLLSVTLAAVGASLLAATTAAGRERAQTDADARAERDRLKAGSYALPALHRVDPVTVLEPGTLALLTTELSRLAVSPGEAWDLPRTVDASAREGGRLVLHHAPTRHGVRLLALVDRESGDHPYLHVYDALLAALTAAGATVERWDFTGAPEHLASPKGVRLPLAELLRRRADARVLVFTRLLDPFGVDVADRTSWVSSLAPLAGHVVLIDPDPRPPADRLLPGALPHPAPPHLPLSPDGLLAAARHLREGGRTTPNWPTQPPVDEAVLGRWAAAAALVPQPRWAHLDDLRRAFFARELPHWSAVASLLDHLVPGEPGHGDHLPTDAALPHLERLRRTPEGADLERRVHRRLRSQLADCATALREAGDTFAATVAELKLAVHDAALGERDPREVVAAWLCTGVRPELERLVADETGLAVSVWPTEVREEVQSVLRAEGVTTGSLAQHLRASRPFLFAGGLGAAASALAGAIMLRANLESLEVDTYVRTPATWRLELEAVPTGPTAAPSALADVAEMRFVRLPGGTFTMGSPDGVGASSEQPANDVMVSSFDIGVTEVTQAQWRAVMGTAPFDCGFGCGDDLPAHAVAWLDAVAFLNELSKLEGLESCYYDVDGKQVTWPAGLSCPGFRLPTEAEWEYAARAGTVGKYSFGDEDAAAVDFAWFAENSGVKAHTVATKKPNPWGLYDVHGNVWEWTWDSFLRNAYRRGSSVDPIVVSGNTTLRVLRGGSYLGNALGLRSAARAKARPWERKSISGFRCVRSATNSVPP